MTRLVFGAVMMLQNLQHLRYKTMDWPAYMAELLNRLPALTDPKAVVSLKAGDLVREIHASFEAGKAKDDCGTKPTEKL